ncbi:MAG: nucleotidyltransferase family protein [Magnetococcales bacterium]|nr:nucleotidyltransferase family protein [Magnetococcales bacterium]
MIVNVKQAEIFPDEAIVLAGGLGKRLRSLVPELPKPMAPVAGRPFLARLLGWLARQGVRRVILSVGYRREVIMEGFGARFQGMELDYAVEEEPLGTAGGIRLGLARVRGSEAFLLNGDTWFDVPLARLVACRVRQGAEVTMAVKPMADCGRYGAVSLDDNGRVTGFREKGVGGPGRINGGVFLISTALREALTGCFSFESDYLQARIATLHVAAVVSDGDFIDIGVPEDYLAAQTLLAERE